VKRRHRRGATVVAVAGAIAVAALGSALASGSFTVSSTLSDRHVLPHRIHWLGKPSLPPSEIREVDFLIDGRRAWVEHHAPYSYGYDGNYLVTTWMRPGVHMFPVAAVAIDGRPAAVSSRAQTSAPKPPPAALAGSWHRKLSSAEAAAAGGAGIWTLTVDAVGWRLRDQSRRRGGLIDVAYLSPDTLEARGGIATRDHDPRENNPWCDEPFQPVRYDWHVAANRLKLTLTGPRHCDGQSRVWAGDWTRR
jgi:hypothetical protein